MQLANYLECRGHGALAELSKAIGAHAPDMSRWASGDRVTPEWRCPAIESETNGAVTCEELRPDKPWRRIPDESWPHPAGRPVLDFAAAKEMANA